MLKVDGLRSRYGRIEVLHDICMDVHAGEIVALIGSNGAGKTTFLRALSGIQPITAGEIVFDGRCINDVPPPVRVSLGISQVPEGRQVFGPLTVADNLRLGAYLRRDSEIGADIDRCYQMFRVLEEKQNEKAGTLSGGQQQMLAVARALMARPKLMLLDEPSLGLAPLVIKQIFESIRLLRETGVTVLLVDQNASAALRLADRAYVLEVGSIKLSGKSADLLNNPWVSDLYLGSQLDAEDIRNKGVAENVS